MNEIKNGEKISFGSMVGYGLGDFAGNFVMTPTMLYLMIFFTDVAMISAAAAGLIFTIGRIYDAFTDPVVGYLADHTRSRWGQKRPFILFGALPLGISMFLVFQLPDFSDKGKFIYYLIVMLLIWTFFTITMVPWSAMLPNLTQDAQERSKVAGVSRFFHILALLLIGGATMPIVNAFGDTKTGYTALGLIYGVVIVAALLLVFWGTTEKHATQTPAYRLSDITLVAKTNRPFILLMFTTFLTLIAISVVATMINYYFKYYFKNEDFIPVAFSLLFVMAGLSIPVWSKIIRHLGKRKTQITSNLGYALALSSTFLIPAGHYPAIISALVLSGIFYGGLLLSGMALLPDTVEYGEWKLGMRTEGIQYGINGFVVKAGSSVAGLIIGLSLKYCGYMANAAQTETSLLCIRVLISLVPGGLVVLSMLIFWFYPITEAMHQHICLDIAARKPEALAN